MALLGVARRPRAFAFLTSGRAWAFLAYTSIGRHLQSLALLESVGGARQESDGSRGPAF